MGRREKDADSIYSVPSLGLWLRDMVRFLRGLGELQRNLQIKVWLFAAFGTLVMSTSANVLIDCGVSVEPVGIVSRPELIKAQVGEQGKKIENGGERVFLFGDPRDRFDAERMRGPPWRSLYRETARQPFSLRVSRAMRKTESRLTRFTGPR